MTFEERVRSDLRPNAVRAAIGVIRHFRAGGGFRG